METIKIEINDREFNLLVTKTEEEKIQGLSNTESLPEDGMLFDYSDDPQTKLTFNTIEMNYPIDIVFVNTDDEVIAVVQGEPRSTELIECVCDDNELIKYVIEVEANSNIQIGDEIDNVDEEEVDKMYVLGPDGKSQMVLVGNERICSRIHTRGLIKRAKRANKTKQEKDYKKLGEYMISILDIQNTQEPEYV